MPPIRQLLNILKTPFKVVGGLGEFAEFSASSLFHPEQILSKSPRLKQLYNFTVKEERLTNLAKEHFLERSSQIATKYGLDNPERADQFLNLLELPTHLKRLPTAQELALYPTDIKQAVMEHLRDVHDPIWEIAKKADPKIGYIAGHFTHFPAKAIKNSTEMELKRVEKFLAEVADTPENAHIRAGFQVEKDALFRKLQKDAHIDDTMNALRYQRLPTGGYFGPLSEHRAAPNLDYLKNYREVEENYIEGAMRKIFLDRYMKKAIPLVESEPNTALRQYAFDYVTAQRGALASKRRIFLNESLSKLFPDSEGGYRNIAGAVDWVTRFQYLTKIGLSWFRFPFVNATQPLLTTYPMVGGKNLLMGYHDALMNPQIWKEARDVGVIFEANLRKGITEVLGRGTKLTAVERGLSWPAKISEELNRVVTYAAGKRQALQMGLDPRKTVEHGINLVNRTQFLYHKSALPLIMSQSPAGRLIFQFRTFTANYVNFLTQLIREKQWPQFAKAIGSLSVLAGTSALPFGAWEGVRKLLLRKAGVDIGDFNPIESGTEALGISPPVNFGASLEPFNIPNEVSQIFGPTAGPVIQFLIRLQQKPEEAGESFRMLYEGISPPVTRLLKGAFQREVRTKPTMTIPQGRVIGERGLTEMMFMRPPLEATRRKYIELMANAMVGNRPDLVKQFEEKARKMGIKMGDEERRQAKARASRLKGVEESGPPKLKELTPAPVRRPNIINIERK